MKVTTYLDFKVGDVIVSKDRVWSKDLRAYIKKGKEIHLQTMDDIILLPNPSKWTKK